MWQCLATADLAARPRPVKLLLQLCTVSATQPTPATCPAVSCLVQAVLVWSSVGVVSGPPNAACFGECAGLMWCVCAYVCVQVRMQTEGRGGKFKGPLDCLVSTVKKEGVLGLYKGVMPPLIATGFINSGVYGIQGLLLMNAMNPKAPTVREQTRIPSGCGEL